MSTVLQIAEPVVDAVPLPGIYPVEFEQAFLGFFVVCSAVFLAMLLLTYLIWRDWVVIERVNFAVSIVSGGLPAIMVPLVVWPGLVETWELGFSDPAKLPSMVSPTSVTVACGMSIGYMFYDLLVLLVFFPVWIRPKDRAKRKSGQMAMALYLQMLMHHILSILFWPVAVTNNYMSYLVAYFMFTEATNIALNARTLALQLAPSLFWLKIAVNLMFFVMFTIIRMFPMPVILYFAILSDYSGVSPLLNILCLLTAPVPFLLNLMWYHQIFGMFLVQLGLKNPPKKKKKEKST